MKWFVEDMCKDSLVDVGVRMVIGEMYVWFGDEVEVKCVFFEIVEMVPFDEFVRRWFGDFYCAYGWFEDVYC